MSHAVQGRTSVPITQLGDTFAFTVPEDLLPDGTFSLPVSCPDDIESKLRGAGTEKARALCAVLLTEERCIKVRSLIISRNQQKTDFKVLLSKEENSGSIRGRIDAALRSCGFEPAFTH